MYFSTMLQGVPINILHSKEVVTSFKARNSESSIAKANYLLYSPLLCSEMLNKSEQDFLDIQYMKLVNNKLKGLFIELV